MSKSGDNVGADQLRAFFERIERLDDEITGINGDKREIFAEAKATGFDVKAMKVVLQRRRMDPDKRAELDTLVELYIGALEGKSSPAPARVETTIQFQPARVATGTELRDAYRAGNPISQDFAFQSGSVYFIAFRGLGRVKIGVSRDSDRRIASLEKTVGDTAEILAVIPGNRQAEMAAHEHHAQWRIDGEWYELSDELIASIEGYTRAGARDQSTAAGMDRHADGVRTQAGLADESGVAPRLPQMDRREPDEGSDHNGVVLNSEAGIKPRPSILNFEALNSLFEYDADAGVVAWKVNYGTAKAGDRAGSKRPSGYRMIQIDGRRYQEHRIAWILALGELPGDDLQIDHANQIKDDNRLINLRTATRAQQQINSPTQTNNKHGRGVGWRADRGVWRADIYVDGDRVFLGHFEQQEDAQAAYEDAALEHYGEFAPQAPPVDTHLEIAAPAQTGKPTPLAGVGGDEDRPPLSDAAQNALRLRPHCQAALRDEITKCGGFGKVTCFDCSKAHADAEGQSA